MLNNSKQNLYKSVKLFYRCQTYQGPKILRTEVSVLVANLPETEMSRI